MTEDKSKYLIDGSQGKWEVVIGLEVHAQVSSKSKLFSGSSTTFGAEPNTQVSLVDSAFPGMLPVINKYCVEQAVKTGLGINAQINSYSVFDRKNYFYADLPQGYQISQFKNPIVGEGEITLDLKTGTKKIGIERLHLEQDAGKSIHDLDPSNTFVDLNRSGIALMEIVSKPDLRSPDEVNAYVKKLRSIMRYLGTCDGNMQEGSLRADVNVSVRKVGDGKYGTRCEIKNVNSIKFMQMAIEYEANRKEDAHDYRYFPDPDLLPLNLDKHLIEKIKKDLPELPDQKKERFIKDYSLSSYEANVLVSEKEVAVFFEEVIKTADKKLTTNWIIGDLFASLNEKNIPISDSPIIGINLW
jgi:aspartyl-tRNA(Asn)/glutamyl-tRNA(Gln) amidotransferase subunit B